MRETPPSEGAAVLTCIEALNYRSLRDVRVDVAPFQMLVGPNGSGKSTLLDVVGFLGDMLHVGPRVAILGKGATVPQRAADPQHLCWMRHGKAFELAVELEVPPERLERLGNGKAVRARYEVRVEVAGSGGEVRLAAENLWLVPVESYDSPPTVQQVFPTLRAPRDSFVPLSGTHSPKGWKKVVAKSTLGGNDYFMAETTGWNAPFRLGPTKSALANLPEDEEKFPIATWARRVLMEGVRRVTLNAEAMRRPSPPGAPTEFAPDGSNLPWAVQALAEENPDRFVRWVDHLRTAIPELRSVSTIERPEDRHRYLVVEYDNGLTAPSWVVSDGTLRLLALTLLAYVPGAELVYLIEEPENGIHPRAVETVYQSLSSVYGAQVLCASHSPIVLGLAKPADLLCFAKDSDGATDIVRGDQHPRLRDWQGTLDLGTLFAAGVLG